MNTSSDVTPGDVRSAVADGRWGQAFEYAFALPDREVWQAYIEDHHKRREWDKVSFGLEQILKDSIRGWVIVTADFNFLGAVERFATVIRPTKMPSRLADVLQHWQERYASQEEAQAGHAHCLRELSNPLSRVSLDLEQQAWLTAWIQQEES